MKTIIHIDNSEFFRKVVKSFLGQEGFTVEGFDNAEEAGMAISGGLASMVISGLAFAGMEGEDFIRRTRENYAGPLVVLSSSLDPQKEAALRSLGVKAAISKAGPWQEALKAELAAL
ncbi:MAG: response regulator [Spirochaetaceae bacterium]|jgi:DNA-binding response OmpR family regulator|nr:response regulator [Spirochaetaceae bacterium]